MFDFLSGKKTYLVAALWAVCTFLYSVGMIDKPTYDLIQGVLLPAGLAALRSGVTK